MLPIKPNVIALTIIAITFFSLDSHAQEKTSAAKHKVVKMGVSHRPDESVEAFCLRIWQLIVNHEQLKASAVQLMSELQQAEILCLLVEEIDLSQFSQAEPT